MVSEGTRRLSIFVGTMGVVCWLIFILFGTLVYTPDKISTKGWITIFIGIPVCFFVPFGIVRGITWVIGGFSKDKKN